MNKQMQSEKELHLEDPEKSSPSLVVLKPKSHVYFDIALILACVLIVFGRTLTNYFLADDFGELHYIHRIFNGNLDLLWSNFTGNYMQIPGMSVYRPFLLLSLMADFAIWHGNSFGYYLTNVSFYFFDAVLLYLIVDSLLSKGNSTQSRMTALASSLFFALSPLHCESVSWVLGRVDIVCAFFYLLSIRLIIATLDGGPKVKTITALAIAAFISALFVKEMAIGIPVIAFGLGLFYSNNDGKFLPTLKHATLFSLPYVAATCLYFLLRYVCLGTLVGGYVAGFGASQETNLITRWLDPDTMRRISFPLVLDHFSNEKAITFMLTALYAATGTIFVLKAAAKQISFKFFLFVALWTLSTLLPIYKLWGLGHHLEGSRFLFFFTLPLSVLFAGALFQNEKSDSVQTFPLQRSFMLVSSAVAATGLLLYAYVATKTNLIWVNSGKEVRAAALSAQHALSENTATPAVFLGIPQEFKGTHMILNGDTFRLLLNPPFTSESSIRKFATFEPIMYSPSHEIDTPRLKKLISSNADLYVWNKEKRDFEKTQFSGGTGAILNLQLNTDAARVETSGLFKRTNNGFLLVNEKEQADEPGIALANMNLNPLHSDFLEAEIDLRNVPQNQAITASWGEGKKVDSVLDSKKTGLQKVYLPLSRNWTWFQKTVIDRVQLNLPKGAEVEVRSLRFIPESEAAPILSMTGLTPNENGIYHLPKEGANLEVDATALDGAESIVVEISAENYFFDNFKRSGGKEAVSRNIKVAGKKGRLHIDENVLLAKASGFFQLRAHALDAEGHQIMANSSCITLTTR